MAYAKLEDFRYDGTGKLKLANYPMSASLRTPESTSPAPQEQNSPSQSAYLSGTSFAPETEDAINGFIATYGKDTLLAYLVNNRLTAAEAFDMFAVRCDADGPNNVLGITYGYLDNYDSHHSHEEVSDEKDALPMAA